MTNDKIDLKDGKQYEGEIVSKVFKEIIFRRRTFQLYFRSEFTINIAGYDCCNIDMFYYVKMERLFQCNIEYLYCNNKCKK